MRVDFDIDKAAIAIASSAPDMRIAAPLLMAFTVAVFGLFAFAGTTPDRGNASRMPHSERSSS